MEKIVHRSVRTVKLPKIEFRQNLFFFFSIASDWSTRHFTAIITNCSVGFTSNARCSRGLLFSNCVPLNTNNISFSRPPANSFGSCRHEYRYDKTPTVVKGVNGQYFQDPCVNSKRRVRLLRLGTSPRNKLLENGKTAFRPIIMYLKMDTLTMCDLQCNFQKLM